MDMTPRLILKSTATSPQLYKHVPLTCRGEEYRSRSVMTLSSQPRSGITDDCGYHSDSSDHSGCYCEAAPRDMPSHSRISSYPSANIRQHCAGSSTEAAGCATMELELERRCSETDITDASQRLRNRVLMMTSAVSLAGSDNAEFIQAPRTTSSASASTSAFRLYPNNSGCVKLAPTCSTFWNLPALQMDFATAFIAPPAQERFMKKHVRGCSSSQGLVGKGGGSHSTTIVNRLLLCGSGSMDAPNSKSRASLRLGQPKSVMHLGKKDKYFSMRRTYHRNRYMKLIPRKAPKTAKVSDSDEGLGKLLRRFHLHEDMSMDVLRSTSSSEMQNEDMEQDT